MCKSSTKIIGSRQKSKPVYNIYCSLDLFKKSVMREKREFQKTLIFQLIQDESLELNTIDDINKVKNLLNMDKKFINNLFSLKGKIVILRSWKVRVNFAKTLKMLEQK